MKKRSEKRCRHKNGMNEKFHQNKSRNKEFISNISNNITIIIQSHKELINRNLVIRIQWDRKCTFKMF